MSLLPASLLLFVLTAGSVSAQSAKKDCFEVKYLDLFGLDSREISWADSEIDGLLTLVGNDREAPTFLIPAIVKQLADYHPCNKKKSYDQERFLKLVNLYVAIRGEPIAFVRAYSFINQHIEAIRKDFYDQVLSDKVLPSLIYTMDDGPLYGEVLKAVPKSKTVTTTATPFGEIRFTTHNDRLYAVAVSKRGKTLWMRILKGTNPDRYLSRISPGPIAVDTYEAVVVVSPFIDGERLSMYLRLNGSFVYYTHSW